MAAPNPFLKAPSGSPPLDSNPFLVPQAPDTSEPNPFMAPTGLQAHLYNPLKRGVHELAASGATEVALKNQADLQALDKIDQLQSTDSQDAHPTTSGFDESMRFAQGFMDNPDISAYVKGTPEQKATIRQKMQGGITAGVQGIVEQNAATQAIPTNPGLQTLADQIKSKDWLGVARTLVTTPSIATDTALESAPQMASAVALTPLVGPAAASGVSSFMNETGQDFVSAMQAAGIDTNDPTKFAAAMQDPALVQKAKDMALKKGIPVALFDALSGGMAGKQLAPASIFGKPLGHVGQEAANIALNVPVQAGLGATGEAIGQMTQSGGKVTDPLSVLLEAVGEAGGAPGEVLGLGVASGRLLASPDHDAPASESETMRLLGGDSDSGTDAPPASSAPEAPAPGPAGEPPTAGPVSEAPATPVGEEVKPRDISPEQPGVSSSAGEPERLVRAALKVGDKIFMGTTHGDAYEQAKAAGVPDDQISKVDQNGYVTSTGRFVGRQEARQIAARSGQKKRIVNGSVTSQGTLSPTYEEMQKARAAGTLPELYKSYGLGENGERVAATPPEASVAPTPPAPTQPQATNAPPINVIPPSQGRRVFLHRPAGVPQKASGPLGPGTYYVTNPAHYTGQDTETRETAELKSIVVQNDQQWTKLTQAAGWASPVPSTDPATRAKEEAGMRAVVQGQGFNAVGVKIPSDVRTDFNDRGKPIKQLRQIFGHSQVAVYDNAPEAQHVTVPAGAQTKRGGSHFMDLPSQNVNLAKIYPGNYDPNLHKPGTVWVIGGNQIQHAASNSKIKPFMQELLNKFMKGSKIVLDMTSDSELAKLGKNAAGQFVGTRDGTAVIWINPRYFDAGEAFAAVPVIAHEMGHAVAWWNWYNTDAATQRAVMEEYQSYLTRSAGMRVEEAMAETQNIWTLAALAADSDNNERVLRGETLDANAERLKRWFNFDEWMAEQFSRWATTDAKPFTLVEKYFKSVADKIKQVFRFFGIDTSHSAAGPVMTAWFRSIQERNERMVPSSTPFAVLHSQLKGVQQVARELNEDWGVDGPTPSTATIGLRPLLNAMAIPVKQAAQVDKFNWWINKTWHLIQIAAKNPHIVGLQNFVEAMRQFHISKMALVSRADFRVREWRKLGKGMAGKLSAFLFDMDSMSYLKPGENGRWPTTPELVKLAQAHGLSKEALDLYMKIKDDFGHVLDKMQAAWQRDAQAAISDPTQLQTALANIASEMANLRAKPYFPHSRFGEWTMTGKDALGNTVFFQQFSTKREAIKAGESYERSNPAHKANTGRLPREVAQFRGLPPALVKSIAGRLNLTAAQQRQLDDLLLDLSPANSAAKRFKRRQNTPGYSLDGMRAYASYFMTMSGWLSRLENGPAMQEAIKWVQTSARVMTGVYAADAVHKRNGIAEWMQRSFDYLNSNDNELQGLRSFAFVWYLGYNVSSALINLTQVPMVALPHLSARFGDFRAMNELRRAYTGVRGQYQMRPSTATPELKAAFAEAIKQGFIDESMAAELASAASGGTLMSMLPGTKIQRGLMNFANIGAIPFQLVEKMNRRVVFQAAFRLAQKQPNSAFLTQLASTNPQQLQALVAQGWTDTNAKAFLAAREAVEMSQFEYAKWARPEFMRGKQAALFTFFMFKQNMLWYLKNGAGAGRAWLMLLAGAGLMGLPGADALDDIIKRLSKMFGHYFNPQLELRKLLVEQTSVDPDLVMHGLGFHTLGLSILGDALGVPVPDVDLSSRIGMQQTVPGLHPALAINQDSFDERAGKVAEEVVGAGFNVPLGILKALTSNDPDAFKQIERGLPTAFKNFATAYRWADTGAETTAGGAETANFDIMDSRSRLDIFAKALGFQPSYLSAKRELTSEQLEAAAYWTIRKQELYAQFAYARQANDSDGIQSAIEAIREYNATAPNGKLKISMSELKTNLRNRLKTNARIEAGVAPTQGLTPVYRDIERAYPNAAVSPRQ